MSKRAGTWRVSLEGYPDVTTDDLTLDELDVAERACGVPYTLMDPHLSVRVAKALLAVMIHRAGASEDQALELAGGLTVDKLHGAFTYLPPELPLDAIRRAAAATEPARPPSPALTSVAG